MNKRIMLPVFAVIAALAIVVGASAFVDRPQSTEETKALSPFFFQYTGDFFSESDYLNPANWAKRGSSSGELCEGNQEVVCVIHAETEGEEVSDLITYLQNQVGTGNIKSFVENPLNIDSRRPEPDPENR